MFWKKLITLSMVNYVSKLRKQIPWFGQGNNPAADIAAVYKQR
jgi:hypothetical protein